MIKADELALWEALLAGEKPRYAAQRLGIHHRRVWWLCRKWSERGMYDWGVVHDLGWVETKPSWRPTRAPDGMLTYVPYTRMAVELPRGWGWLECPNCFQPRVRDSDCDYCGSDDVPDIVTPETTRNPNQPDPWSVQIN